MDMTLPMHSSKKNSSRERVQRLFNNNLDLEKKRRNAGQERIRLDPHAWQTMRENYEAILLEDHDFSEEHDVEYALWQLHYRRIEELRALFNSATACSGSVAPLNGKVSVQSGPDRLPKIRSQFKSFLSEATGFYHDLMVKIRAKYGLPLGYFSDVPYNQIPTLRNGNKSSEVKKGLISCHRCLIYLGDLARYKCLYGEGNSKARDFSAASGYYMQASSLWSSSGNPHHQLAILAGYSNDELMTIYRYFRSLAAENPFVTARDNLIIAFEKNRQTYNQLVVETKNVAGKMPSAKLEAKGRGKVDSRSPAKVNNAEAIKVEGRRSNYLENIKPFTTRFIRLNGILFTRTSLETFDELLLAVKDDFLALLSSGPDEEFNFGSDAAECGLLIVRISAVLIFTVQNVGRDNENHSYADILQRSVLLQNALTALFEFMGCIIERCNQLKDPSKSFLFPGIAIFAKWLACHQNLAAVNEVDEKQASARSFFWSRCASFLNKLLSAGCISVNDGEDECGFDNMSKYDESEAGNNLALAEDFELKGFVPLLPAQRILDFSRKHSFVFDGVHKENVSRVQRILAAGKALANTAHSGKERFCFDSKRKRFVFGSEPSTFDHGTPSNDLEQDISNGGQIGVSVLPKTDVDAEEEDEEIIVFKPFAAEKAIHDISSKLASSGNICAVGENGKIDFSTDAQPSVFNDNFLLQSTTSAIRTPSSPFMKGGEANGTSQYLSLVHPGTPGWSLDTAPVGGGLSGLKGMNLPPQVPELQGVHEISQPTAVSFSIPQISITHSSYGPSARVLQSHLPFESTRPSGASADVPFQKQSPFVPPGPKKNPVSRPVKLAGPPPGFGTVAPKAVDDTPFEIAPRSENAKTPPLDDYRWLDGYQRRLSSQFVNRQIAPSVDQMDPAFASMNPYVPAVPAVKKVGPISTYISKMNGLIPAETSPFPGMTVLAPQVGRENQVSHDYPFPEYMKHYEKLAQQFQKDNQQAVDQFQPYHGNSVWEGRFFV